jgi:hypothetical protein
MSAARGKSVALVTSALVALLVPGILSTPAVAATSQIEPVSVAIVVPITVAPGDNGMLDADALTILTSAAGALTIELDEVLATTATIALDPMIVASIRALGTAAPESATLWLDRLQSASNDVFLLAYADAELSAFARNDALDLAAPLDLGFALDEGAFGPAQTASPTPTAGPTPSATATDDSGDGDGDDTPPPLPTTEELLAWPDAIGPIAWPAEGSVVNTDLDAYAAAGYQALLLSSANVSETASASVDLGGLRGLVADSAASELLREASSAVDPAARQAAIARLGAALDGLAAAHPGRSVVLTLDRSETRTVFGLAETYAALAARASTQMSGLAAALAGSGESASIVDGTAGDHIQLAPQLFAGAHAEGSFATILENPLLLTGPRRLTLLALLAVQEVDDVDWPDRAAAYLQRSSEIVRSVAIVDGLPILVTSSSTTVPVVISNGLEFPITVRIDARPTRPLLTIDSGREVTIEPGSTKTVRLDAQAVTNGVVDVVFTVVNPHSGATLSEARVEARLEAQWETVGLIGGAVIGLIFAVGIVRNIVLRRRRATRAAADRVDE